MHKYLDLHHSLSLLSPELSRLLAQSSLLTRTKRLGDYTTSSAMASQGSAANPMDVDLPDANKPATDPDANKPATDPDANKPATDPPGKAGQLTPIQIKDIIYKIADYDGQGLPDVLPQGFALTIGEVKAILKDPANRQNDDTENNARLKREYKCDAALTRMCYLPLV